MCSKTYKSINSIVDHDYYNIKIRVDSWAYS